MNRPKSKLVKSKSSNNTVVSISSKSEKKSRSNAEFKPDVLKKRGVYVEKKSNIIPKQLVVNEPKRKVIPRPGKTKFLASVLTILSKCTTGTQYPDINAPETSKKPERKYRRKKDQDKNNYLGDLGTQKKQKYKSRVLNGHDDNQSLDFLVIQDNKINESQYSPATQSRKESEILKWAEYVPNCAFSHDGSTLIGSRSSRDRKVRLVDYPTDPNTLVADETVKDDKKLYNFFVDLLESTFDVYNVQTDNNNPDKNHLPSACSSKVALEIDETIATKLKMDNKVEEQKLPAKPSEMTWMDNNQNTNDATDNNAETKTIPSHVSNKYDTPRRSFNCVYDAPKRNANNMYTMPRRNFIFPETNYKRKPKLKSQSFIYKKSNTLPISSSFNNDKLYSKKARKRNLLSLLKEQLSMDDYEYEEPQNFFQALKVMGKNKKRQRTIHFDERPVKPVDNLYDCMYKRRKLLAKKTRRPSHNNNMYKAVSFLNDQNIKINKKRQLKKTDSPLSLEVYGYDFGKRINFDQRTEKMMKRNESEDIFSLSDMSLYAGSAGSDKDDTNFIPNWMK